ncbi:MAG: glycosyltransferase family 2 protein [Ruminococcaceae bacterium]|nr:glycosyltransferase family 2 protein [Oscillospiraceae bacterium]
MIALKTLTVITTTYNRDYCLHQVYESLLRQTSNDFVWLVLDDGSTDKTKDLVDKWISENKMAIVYHYKPNGGMHTARNAAYELAETELNVIIDSDDWMADDAVETIVRFWQKHKREDIAGIISHNADPSGKQLGTPMPEGVSETTVTDFFGKLGGKGDKKLIYRSELTKKYPYPEFEGEKFFPASYKFRLLDQDYKMLVLDHVTCIVDYNDDSMTRDKFAQYRTSPKSFAYFRNEMMRISKSAKECCNLALHYVAESRFAKEKHFIKKAHRKGYVLLAYLPGTLLYFYLKKTKRKY